MRANAPNEPNFRVFGLETGVHWKSKANQDACVKSWMGAGLL